MKAVFNATMQCNKEFYHHGLNVLFLYLSISKADWVTQTLPQCCVPGLANMLNANSDDFCVHSDLQ